MKLEASDTILVSPTGIRVDSTGSNIINICSGNLTCTYKLLCIFTGVRKVIVWDGVP